MIAFITLKNVEPGQTHGEWVSAKDLPEKEPAETEERRPKETLTYPQKINKEIVNFTHEVVDEGYPIVRIGSKLFRFGLGVTEESTDVSTAKGKYRLLPIKGSIVAVQTELK